MPSDGWSGAIRWGEAGRRHGEYVVSLVRISWPVLLWLGITVTACANNPAVQSIWATFKHSTIVVVPPTHRWATVASMAVLSACFFIGAKASLDGARFRAPGDPALPSFSTLVPFLTVTLLVLFLVTASDRFSYGGWQIALITAIYGLFRIGALLRWLDDPGPLRMGVCAGCVLLALMAINAAFVPPLSFVGFLIFMTELLIWWSSRQQNRWRWWGIGAWLLGGYLGLKAFPYVIDDVDVYAFIQPYWPFYAGVAALYLARSGVGWRRVLGYVGAAGVFGVGLLLFLIMQAASFQGDRLPSVAGIAIIFATLIASRRTTSAWRARTYALIALMDVVVILMVSIAVVTLGRVFTQTLGALAFALGAFGLWGLLALLAFVYLPRRTGQLRWSIGLIGVVIVGQWLARPEPLRLPSDPGVDTRTDFESFVRARVAHQGAKDYYVVAAAGGGLRAAAHTAQVLEALDTESCGVFGDRLLAVSSVSGGSLGAAAFMLSPDRGKSLYFCEHPEARAPGTHEYYEPMTPTVDPVSLHFVRRDYVSSTLASFLFPGVVHGLVPALFANADRGDALREDWETSWSELTPQQPWSQPLLRSRLAQPDQPALLLNTTSVITGERLVASTKRYHSDSFRDFFDVGASYRAIPVSAAVLNSARFPVVSPASRVLTSAPDTLSGWSAARLLRMHNSSRLSPDLDSGSQVFARYLAASPRAADYVVDGGYFENSGAETLLELVPKIQALLPPGARLHAIIIHNAPVRPGDLACSSLPEGYDAQTIELPVRGKPGLIQERTVSVGGDVRPFATTLSSGEGIGPPINAFLNVREARGRLAERNLAQLLGCDHVHESYFLDEPLFPSPPLTWFMDGDMHYRLKMSSDRLLRQVKQGEDDTLWDAIPGVNRKLLCPQGNLDIPQCQ